MMKNYKYVCIKPTLQDKARLLNAFDNELKCYNYLINNFQNLLKSDTLTLKVLDENILKNCYINGYTDKTLHSFYKPLPFELNINTKLNMHIEYMYYLKNNFKTQQRILYNLTLENKRHVQLEKNQVKYKQVNGEYFISTPYTNDILIDKKSPVIRNFDWTHILIHQQPLKLVTSNSNWFVEFRKNNLKYDLEYIDYIPYSKNFLNNNIKNFFN